MRCREKFIEVVYELLHNHKRKKSKIKISADRRPKTAVVEYDRVLINLDCMLTVHDDSAGSATWY